MYIQLTTKCNMSCPHCLYSCEQGKPGEFMSKDTFNTALDLAAKMGDYATLGGGEPTLHPKFWDFMGKAIGSACEGVWLATNGSTTQTALALAKMAKSGVIGCALSQDEFHDPISPEVIKAFTRSPKGYSETTSGSDCREIRNVSGNVVDKGAAHENGLGDVANKCGCPDVHVKPDGRIFMCGCADSLYLGTIKDIDPEILVRARESLDNEGCGENLAQTTITYILKG